MATENLNFAVIYAYFEKNGEYRRNLDFFIKKGVYANNENIDYYIVVNGNTDYNFPQHKNLKVVYRENTGFDFAGYNYGIQESKKNKEYDYYFFINTSCRGPFLPDYCKDINWLTPFIQLFNKDPTVELAGVTINPLTWSFIPHVQSYFFVMKQSGLIFIEDSGLFCKNFDNIGNVIEYQEIELSLLFLRAGKNISCIIPEYQNLNYSQALKDLNERGCYSAVTINNRTFCCTGTSGDIVMPGKKCFGRDIHPYEIIFVKTERKISADEVQSITNNYGI